MKRDQVVQELLRLDLDMVIISMAVIEFVDRELKQRKFKKEKEKIFRKR